MTAQPATARTATATVKANAKAMSAVAPRIGARALCDERQLERILTTDTPGELAS